MQDRQQNINIKFNTNSVDLEKANQLLNKAKAANDALNQSIQKTGTEGRQNVVQFSKTIAGLQLQMQQLKAQIDLTNQSDKSRLEQLRTQYAAMSTQLKQYQGELSKTTAAQKSMVDGLGGLYSMIRVALTAGLIKETISATIEMAKLKGTVDGVTRAFNNLPNATLLMADLRAKTHGTLDELTLMQKAVQAKNFKIPLEQLGNLLEFAAVKAQQTGIDINYLVDSLITGLGRNSIKILDNLQFSVVELREKTKELGSTQAAVFFLVNKQMKEMGGFLETDAVRVDKLSASWKNFKINLAERLETGGIIAFFDKVVTGWELLLGGSFRFKAAQEHAIKTVSEFKKGNDLLLDSDKKIQNIELELDKLRKRRLEDGGKLVDLNLKLKETSGGFFGDKDDNKRAQLIQAQIEAIGKRNDVTAISITLLEEYAKALRRAIPDKELGIIETYNEKVKTTNEQIEQSTDVTGKFQKEKIKDREEFERIIAVYSLADDELEKYVASLDKGMVKSKSFREEIVKQIDEISKKLNDALTGKTDISKGLFQSVALKKGAIPPGGFQGPLGPADTTKDGVNSPKARLDAWYDQYATFWDKLKMGFDDLGTHIRKGGVETVEDQRRMWAKVAREVTDGLSTILKDQLESFNSQEVASLDFRLKSTQSFYEKQITLAGDNQNRVSLLRRKEEQEITRLQRDRDKAALRQARGSILINTAAAIVKALVEAPWPYNLVLAAVYGGMGASQLAILNRAPRGYAKGVINLQGPGTETSDSINVKASKGESIITAAATRDSMGLLKAIQARRINDRMIDEIIAKTGGSQGSNLDAKGIIAAIKSQPKPPDYFRVSENIFEAKKINDTTRRYVRRGFLG